MFFRYFQVVFSNLITRTKLPSLVYVMVACCFVQVFVAHAADNPKILVLHSYHSGFQWTDDQNAAIIKSLQAAYPKGDVFVEYMNTKRVALEVMSPMLRQNYTTLYRNARFDVIITTDNNALDFMLKYGDELFPGVPVVFCSINNFDDYDLGNRSNYTGVREDFDTAATLDIMLRFHPDTRTVAMIADVTESSQITLRIAREVAKKYEKVRFVELSGLSETVLAEELGKLEKGTVILLLSYYRSPEGRVFSVKDGVQLIQKHTQLPVYALWDFYMLPPVIGGKIVTGTLQGKAAAEIAIRILNGEKPETIAPYSCPTSYYFNYDALQKYAIPDSLIPTDSIIAGKPDTLYARYKTYIQGGVAFALSLIAAILILLRSIVLQRRNAALLRASEEKFRILFENAIEGIFQTAFDGRLLNANPAMAHILAYESPDELQAQLSDVSQLYLHPGQRELFLSSILQQGTVHGQELQFINKDKQTIWVAINARLVRDDAGTPLFIEGFLSDISNRKRAEEEVRHLKNYLSNIIDSMPSLLAGLDREGRVTQWNRQAEANTGIAAAEAVGRKFTELVPDFTPWIEQLRSETQRRRPASLEKLLIEKEGERHFYDLMLYPLVGNGIEGTVVRIEDVTEQARIQELMIQTEKMISVGGLAAGMAHEINNPLGIITQAAQNIERRVLPELSANRQAAEESGISLDGLAAYFERRQIPEFIASIREAVSRASRIITNILRFSRHTEKAMQRVPLADVMEQALELAANDYDLKKKYDFRCIELVRNYQPDMPDVPMTATEIEQVLLNLLKNAAQAMIANPPERKPQMVLRIRTDGPYAMVEVEDNGPGMSEEVRRRVFEPFFTTKEPGVGTGLGLSVSYMIVTQNHNGVIEAASLPGKGARFTVRLPLDSTAVQQRD